MNVAEGIILIKAYSTLFYFIEVECDYWIKFYFLL